MADLNRIGEVALLFCSLDVSTIMQSSFNLYGFVFYDCYLQCNAVSVVLICCS